MIKWNDREVYVKEFTIKEMKPVREAFAADNENGMWYVLSLTVRYKDDDTQVFPSVDDVLALPAKYILRLTRLAQEAMKVNGIIEDEASPLS